MKNEHINVDDDWAQAPPQWNIGYHLMHKRATWRCDPNPNRTRSGRFNKIGRVFKIMMIKSRSDQGASRTVAFNLMVRFTETSIPRS